VGALKKPVIADTGPVTVEEAAAAIDVLRRAGGRDLVLAPRSRRALYRPSLLHGIPTVHSLLDVQRSVERAGFHPVQRE